jgi:arsenate reductase-like glutaredoxin family protein
MSDKPTNQFKIQINFTKAYKDDAGNHFVEGIASGPEVDLTDERMTLSALKSMVESLNRRIVEFRSEHSDHWNAELGEIVELSLTSDNHLFYKAKLDMGFSASRDFWYAVTEKGRKLGVSIAGVAKAGYEYVADLGRDVYSYFDVDLYEISVTRQAAYQYSFANAVTKSLPRNEEPMTKSEKPTPEVVETPAEEPTQPETDLTEEAAAAADAPSAAQEPIESEDAPEAEPNQDEPQPPVDAPTPDEPAEEAPEEAPVDEEQPAEEETPEADPAPVEPEPEDEIEQTKKSLTEATAQVEQLTKSLAESTAKVEELQKSLSDATTELETTKTSLKEKETELEKMAARKGIVFGKFGGKEEPNTTQDEVVKASQEKFASFIITGAR